MAGVQPDFDYSVINQAGQAGSDMSKNSDMLQQAAMKLQLAQYAGMLDEQSDARSAKSNQLLALTQNLSGMLKAYGPEATANQLPVLNGVDLSKVNELMQQQQDAARAKQVQQYGDAVNNLAMGGNPSKISDSVAKQLGLEQLGQTAPASVLAAQIRASMPAKSGNASSYEETTTQSFGEDGNIETKKVRKPLSPPDLAKIPTVLPDSNNQSPAQLDVIAQFGKVLVGKPVTSADGTVTLRTKRRDGTVAVISVSKSGATTVLGSE